MIVIKREDKKFILTASVGEATLENGDKVELLQGMNGAPIIRFDDGTTVGFDWGDIIDIAIKEKNKADEKG